MYASFTVTKKGTRAYIQKKVRINGVSTTQTISSGFTDSDMFRVLSLLCGHIDDIQSQVYAQLKENQIEPDKLKMFNILLLFQQL